MVQLPRESYKVLDEVLQALDFSPQQRDEYRDDFEKTLLMRMVQVVMQKLPPQESGDIAKLANGAAGELQQKAIEKKLSEWLTEHELVDMTQKQGDRLFADFVRHMYTKAAEIQKKKLESLFKPEVLRG